MQTNGTPEIIAAMFGALAKASAELMAAPKDAAVDTGRYRHSFASLNAILCAAKPILAKHGLSIVQCPALDGNLVRVTTSICHEAGGSLSSQLSMPFGQNTPQAIGSAITYARRYALRAMLALGEDDEDDGAAAAAALPPVKPSPAKPAATKAPTAKPAQAPAAPPPDMIPTERQVATWEARINDAELLVQIDSVRESCRGWKLSMEQKGRLTNAAREATARIRNTAMGPGQRTAVEPEADVPPDWMGDDS